MKRRFIRDCAQERGEDDERAAAQWATHEPDIVAWLASMPGQRKQATAPQQRWQFQDGEQWKHFNKKAEQVAEAAYTAWQRGESAASCSYRSAGTWTQHVVTLDFVQMTQSNSSSGKSRSVRRLAAAVETRTSRSHKLKGAELAARMAGKMLSRSRGKVWCRCTRVWHARARLVLSGRRMCDAHSLVGVCERARPARTRARARTL